jgi:hypothetical protein
MTDYWKTLVCTGFYAFFPAIDRAITMVISPLLTIYVRPKNWSNPLAIRINVKGKTDTPMNRHAIARGGYTDI